jgi:hypothetical protein
MRWPDRYDEMIQEIARVASNYGFMYMEDSLEDKPPHLPGEGHEFSAVIRLGRNGGDFTEDAPIPVLAEEGRPG